MDNRLIKKLNENLSLKVIVIILGHFIAYLSGTSAQCPNEDNYSYEKERAAIYPYNITATNWCLCRAQCDGDTICNGYSFHYHNNSCSLSSCNTSSSLYPSSFFKKRNPESPISCVPVTTMSYITTSESVSSTREHTTIEQTTPEEQQTTIEQTTPKEQQTTMKQTTPEEQQTTIEQTTPEEQQTTMNQTTPEKQQTTIEETTPEEQQTTMKQTTPEEQQTTIEHTTPEEQQTIIEQNTHEERQTTIEQTTHEKQQTTVNQTTPKEQQTTIKQTTHEERQTTIEQTTPEEQQTTIEQTTTEKQSTTKEQTTSDEQLTTNKKYTTMNHITIEKLTTSKELSTTVIWLPTSASFSNNITINDTTQNTMDSSLCVCVCKHANHTIQESIEKRRRELILNKTELSFNIRKRTSAGDNRKASRVVGTVAVIILVLYGLLFFCADILSLLALCRSKMFQKNSQIEPNI